MKRATLEEYLGFHPISDREGPCFLLLLDPQ
jgi:hypothetical protein